VYYSEYSDSEQKDGNSDLKLDTIQDMNIITSVMSALTTITQGKERFGEVLSANYKREVAGPHTNLRMAISTRLWTIALDDIVSEDSKICNIVFLPTEENSQTEELRVSAINTGQLEKLFSQDGCA